MVFPSGEKTTRVITVSSSRRVSRKRDFSRSHILISPNGRLSLSLPAMASVLPSGEHARHSTNGAVVARNVVLSLLVNGLHSFTLPRTSAVASVVLLGLITTSRTHAALFCLSRNWNLPSRELAAILSRRNSHAPGTSPLYP